MPDTTIIEPATLADNAQQERDYIVAFLRAEAAKFIKAAGMHAQTNDIDLVVRMRGKASVLTTAAAYITRGDHMTPNASEEG